MKPTLLVLFDTCFGRTNPVNNNKYNRDRFKLYLKAGCLLERFSLKQGVCSYWCSSYHDNNMGRFSLWLQWSEYSVRIKLPRKQKNLVLQFLQIKEHSFQKDSQRINENRFLKVKVKCWVWCHTNNLRQCEASCKILFKNF